MLIIRSIAKKILPESIRARINYLADRIRYAGLSRQQVFQKVYRDCAWGASTNPNQLFCSGIGSADMSVISEYSAAIASVVTEFPSPLNAVDIGCGDFAVGSRVRELFGRYIACDIVPELIQRNTEEFRQLGVDFRVLDAVTDPIPEGDVVFLRQVLQHLSNRDVLAIVRKLEQRFRYLVVTEHLPSLADFQPNLEKPTGPGIRATINSGIVLSESPFLLNYKREEVLLNLSLPNGILRTTMYELAI